MTDKQQYDSPLVRGRRIRELRDALDLSREEFAKKHGIKTSTLHAWEIGRFDGIPERSAKLVAQAFQNEGLNCKIEWIYYGLGTHPLTNNNDVATLSQPYEIALQEELQLFIAHNRDTIDTTIKDCALIPFYYPGDHVAGVRYFDKALNKALNTSSIIQTLAGETLVRILQAGSKSGHYNLMSVNPEKGLTLDVSDVKILYAAPILWLRRK